MGIFSAAESDTGKTSRRLKSKVLNIDIEVSP
jgi:hypothetical protein